MRTGHWVFAVAAGGALDTAAGCDSSTKGSGTALNPSGSTSPGSAAPSTSAPSSPAPSSPAAPTSAAPSAADGGHVSACADGRCEVAVRAGTAIPVPRSMDVEKLKVTAVTPTRITVTGQVIGNSSFGTCSGSYCNTNSTNGAVTVVLGANSTATQNGLSCTVEHITDGTAIVKIVPAA